MSEESLIKVAVVQFEPKLGENERNRGKIIDLSEKAVTKENADIILLPELANSGVLFNTKKEAYESGEQIPDGPTVKELVDLGVNKNVYIVSGILEVDKSESVLYNSAILTGPEGYIGKYRKNHLYGGGNMFWEPGNLGLQIFNLPFGRIGILICYDAWFPEVSRIYALKGVDLILEPTNWIDLPNVPKNLYQNIHVVMAHVNNIFYVCADRIGDEGGVSFLGDSCIIDPYGFIKKTANRGEEEIITAEINLMNARRKQRTPFNHILNDRRTDLYSEYLGYGSGKVDKSVEETEKKVRIDTPDLVMSSKNWGKGHDRAS